MKTRNVELQGTAAGGEAPLLPDVGVIALVPDVWATAWQPRHHVLSRLAQYFHVVWCDRPYDWRAVLRVNGRQRPSLEGEALAGAFTINRAKRWLPLIGRVEAVRNWTVRQILDRARRTLQSNGCTTLVLYIWRPEYAPALDLIDHDLGCYHIDDEYTFSPVEQPISECERRLIVQADRVFIHSPALMEKKGRLNRHTTFVPNGADCEAFAMPRPEPADMRGIPRPRVGYVGRLKDQLDLGLLARLIARHEGWSFVFVGPQANHRNTVAWVDAMSRLSNVHFLGEKPVGDLPSYVQHLDVCTMCYVMNDYTKFIYPLKLHEYLAAGRPVVATPITSLRAFADVIDLASTDEEWSQCLERALSADADSPPRRRARQHVAREYDWDRLVRVIAHELCAGLGPSYVKRLEAAAGAHPQEWCHREKPRPS